MPRSIADLSLSFGLVSIPVKVFSATEASEAISFNLLHKDCGSRLKQQYKCIKEDVVVERADMVKGYEFAKDQYVIFTPEELKALAEKGTHSVDIVAFIPADSIDPVYYDKAYYLAPDKRGAKPYALLLKGMRETGRCALARWAWKGKQYTVQVRPMDDGLVLQQLLYADEVRSMKALEIASVDVNKPELDLAVQLINQIATDKYDPNEYEDEVKKRITAMVDEKIQGQAVTTVEEPQHLGGGQVIDLMEALRASLSKAKGATDTAKATANGAKEARQRKPVQSSKGRAEASAPRTRSAK
jgi:DNA end-binding protein Ku